MILGGDIGGTKTLLAARDGETTWLSKRYLNARYANFDALLEAFLSELRAVSRAPLERAPWVAAAQRAYLHDVAPVVRCDCFAKNKIIFLKRFSGSEDVAKLANRSSLK